jgi:putative glutamine amidotransferase
MPMKKPLIAVTTNTGIIANSIIQAQKAFIVSHACVDIISSYGGCPVLLPNTICVDDLAEIFKFIDGLFLIGGPDIHPQFYQQKLKIKYSEKIKSFGKLYHRSIILQPDVQRDALEIALYKKAIKKHLPILGICRGMQLINVAEGGTLNQEISKNSALTHAIKSEGFTRYHQIKIMPNTLISKLFGVNEYFTSSFHHQGIHRLGNNLIASAVSKDGIIEIIESARRENFVVGIQGHPEHTRKKLDKYELIFEAFMQRAYKKQKY